MVRARCLRHRPPMPERTGSLLRCGLLCLTLCLPISLVAAPLEPAEARRQIEAKLAALQHYQAEFEQTVTDNRGELREQLTGRFWLTRPDRFRWEYLTPWPRLILADGERIWLYDEELEQVTVREFSGVLEQTPAALLAGRLDLLDGYAVSGERNGETLLVTLVPEGAPGDFRQIDIEFTDSVLAEMLLLDSFGQQTRIRFLRSDTGLVSDGKLFEFAVPEGVDVIDESGTG